MMGRHTGRFPVYKDRCEHTYGTTHLMIRYYYAKVTLKVTQMANIYINYSHSKK